MAGDGKLGGLVAPNDGLCHLNSSGFYDADVGKIVADISSIYDITG